MANTVRRLVAGLAAAFVLLPSPGAAGAGGYENISAQIMKCAEANSLKKIAVLEFSAKGGAGKSDTEYAAEKIGLHLAGSKMTALIERALLEKVLKEARLSSAAGSAGDKAEIVRSMLSLDAVVTGAVFSDGEKLKVLARLIELKTGRVLMAAEAEEGRLPRDFFGGAFSDPAFLDVPVPELPGELTASLDRPGPAAARAGFRDAVAEYGGNSCSGRKRLLGKLNSELVDAKARYWAARMKAPGFNRLTLTKNPGTEIADPGVREKFYKLLSEYFEEGEPDRPEQGRVPAVLDLMKMESQVSNECGL